MLSTPRSRRLVAIKAAVGATLLVSGPVVLATDVPVDFGTFTGVQGVPTTFTTPNWVTNVSTYNNIAVTPGRVAQETTNSDTTFLLGPSSLTTLNKVITGDIYFGNDDDYVGLAVGMPQDPFTNTSADYYLMEWKGATQNNIDFMDGSPSLFHNSTVGGNATAGLSLSHVTGVPTADEFWQRANLTMYQPADGKTAPNPATDTPLGYDTGGLTELGRAATKGTTGFDRTGKRVSFELTYTASNITLKLTPSGGSTTTEFNYNAPAGVTFPDGTLGIYEQSQDGNGAYAYFDVRDIGDAAPTPGPNLSPAGLPFAAGDVSVTAGNTNATSVWSVASGRTTTASPMTIVSTANIGDVDYAIGGTRLTAGGVVLGTVRQNGPRDNGTGTSYYANVEVPNPSGFGTSAGLATFAYTADGSLAVTEWNVNVGIVHLPYATFHAGFIDYATHVPAISSSDGASNYVVKAVPLAMPTIMKYDSNNLTATGFWNAGGVQQTIANVGITGVNSTSGTGLLFANSAANENNTTAIAVLPDGTWNVSVRDASRAAYGGPDTFEEDKIAFAYFEPDKVAESAAARVTGLVAGAPQVAQSWGNYTIDHVKPGVYELVIAGGETYTINALQMALSGTITLGNASATPPVAPVNHQVLTPTLGDSAFSVAFVPFNPGDASKGMLLLANNGTFTMKDSAGVNDVTVPTAGWLTYQVGGVPTWKSTAVSGDFSDAGNYRVGAPGTTDTVNFSHENTGPTTVNLTSTATVANMYFNSPNKYTVAGDGLTVTGDLGAYGGSHEISAPLFATNASILIGAGANLKLSGAVSGKPSAVSIAAGGGLDVVNNNLMIDYSGTSPLDDIRASLRAHFQLGGSVGLYSSVADGVSKTLAYAEASALLGISGTATATYDGQSVDATTIITKMTYFGDANFDGAVDADDYALIDRGYAKGYTGWINGDFDYSGVVDQNDYLLIDRSYAMESGMLLDPEFLAGREARFGEGYVQSLVASVPEPSAVVLLAGGGLLGCRRRRLSER